MMINLKTLTLFLSKVIRPRGDVQYNNEYVKNSINNISIIVSSKISILCDLTNTKINCNNISSIRFDFSLNTLKIPTSQYVIKNDPTIILMDDSDVSGSLIDVIIPIPFCKYVAGGRYGVFDPFYACMMLSHFWISDLGYVIIGNESFKLDDPNNFDEKKYYRHYASNNHITLGSSMYSTTYCKKVSIIQKIKKLHREILKLKCGEK